MPEHQNLQATLKSLPTYLVIPICSFFAIPTGVALFVFHEQLGISEFWRPFIAAGVIAAETVLLTVVINVARKRN